jgi:hypothetical protein
LFHVYTKIYAIHAKFIKSDKSFLAKINIEVCVLLGLGITLLGIALTVLAFVIWGQLLMGQEYFGEFNYSSYFRITIPATTFIVIGIQIVFAGFFINILRMKIK